MKKLFTLMLALAMCNYSWGFIRETLAVESKAMQKQVPVTVSDLVKAVCRAVDVKAVDHACLVHGIEIVIDGRHGNGRHLQLCQKENFVSGQMPIRLLQYAQNQFSLLCHGFFLQNHRMILILLLIIDQKYPLVNRF